MNFKTTLILIVILVAVVAWLLVDRYTAGPGPQGTDATTAQSTAQGKPLFTIKPEDVNHISIAPAEGNKIVMDQSGGKWTITQPVKAAAESWQVDSLARSLTGLHTRGKIEAGINTGLAHPRYQVELGTKDGKTIRLAVGDKTAIGDAMYVRVGDEKQAQIVPSAAWNDLSRPLSDYRDKGLVDVSSEQIKQLSIQPAGKPKIVLVKEGTTWRMTEPKTMPADESAATDLLFAVTGAQVKEYVPAGRAPDAVTQLDQPQLTIWYSTAPPATQPATRSSTQPAAPAGTSIEFGGYDSVLKENVFARVDHGQVVKLPATTLDSFKKTPLDLRDKEVLNLPPDQVQRLTLTIDRMATTQPTTRPASHATIVLTRNKKQPAAMGPALPATRPATTQSTTRPTTQAATKPAPAEWKVSGDHKGHVDDAKVTTLLNDLHPLRAQKFLSAAPSTRPSATYTLVVQSDDGATHTLNLSDEGSGEKLIGQLGDLRFELDRSLVDALEAFK
jgi:hypothetical protein